MRRRAEVLAAPLNVQLGEQGVRGADVDTNFVPGSGVANVLLDVGRSKAVKK